MSTTAVLRRLFPPYIRWSVLCTLVILLHHVAPKMGSMTKLNKDHFPNHVSLFEPQYLKEALIYHKTNPVFVKRKATTYLVETLSSVSGLSIADAFVVINYLLLFLHGILLYHWLQSFELNEKQRCITIILYYASFSMFFIFFPPVYSYDEPLHYACIYAALIAYQRNHRILFTLLFAGSCVIRESSLLLVPFFILMEWAKYPSIKKSTPLFLSLFIACIGYIFYRSFIANEGYSMNDEILARKEAFFLNFKDLPSLSESLFSFFNTVFFPLYFIWEYERRYPSKPVERHHISYATFLVIMNSLLVFLGMLAKESRLFFLPMLLLLPFYIRMYIRLNAMFQLAVLRRLVTDIYFMFQAVVLIGLSWFLSFQLFTSYYSLINEYCFLTSSLFFLYLLLERSRKTTSLL